MRPNLEASRRVLVPATAVATIALIATGLLGVASAEAPTTSTPGTPPPPPRTISVQGVANEAIEQSASAATATAVYRQGMADAIGDGLSKAQFLASKAGGTLGAVQSVVEDGGYIGCTSTEESNFQGYQGAQPDFGSPDVGVSGVLGAPRAANSVAPGVSRPSVKHAKKKKSTHGAPVAKRASVGSCTLSAQVSLTYAIS